MLALLYDVHGNLPALEAVLADAEAAGARRFLLGGDYALFGAWPRETLQRLDGLDAEWIRGNAERWTADPDAAPEREPLHSALGVCRELLGEDVVGTLARLPTALVRDGVRYCHASPGSDTDAFDPAPGPRDGELLDGVRERRVVFGHAHLQFRRVAAGGVELVNPGSVGLPFDGDPRAGYALVRDGEVQLRRVPYDHRASAAAVRERFGPWAETVARRIERSRLVLAV